MDLNREITIKVDPLFGYKARSSPADNTRLESNVSPIITKFIESLSYTGFVLAGNSVANIIENIDIQGDLDFWVLDKNKYLDVLEEFFHFKKATKSFTCF